MAERQTTPLMRNATAADLPAICDLLERNGLPTGDLASSAARFTIASEGSRIIGAGALERFGSAALLRSVVVDPARRSKGLGRHIVKALELQARAAGITHLVLITQTARQFFEHQDYHPVDRAQVPKAVQTSAEFRGLCPASAGCLMKMLR